MPRLINEGGGALHAVEDEPFTDAYGVSSHYATAYFEGATFKSELDIAKKVLELNKLAKEQKLRVNFRVGKAALQPGEAGTLKLAIGAEKIDYDSVFKLFEKTKLVHHVGILELSAEMTGRTTGQPVQVIVNKGGGMLRAAELEMAPDEAGRYHGALYVRHVHTAASLRGLVEKLNGLTLDGIAFDEGKMDKVKAVCRIGFTIDKDSPYQGVTPLRRILDSTEAGLVHSPGSLQSFISHGSQREQALPAR